MDSFDKAVMICTLGFLTFCGVLIYATEAREQKELELKYMAATAGAPLAVCVK
jgi:hypothetical protein